MIIRVSSDLSREEIWANGHELASIMGKDRKDGKRVLTWPEDMKEYVCTFENPVLMTDNYRISQLPPTLRDTLFSLFAEKPRIVEYDGVSVRWEEKHKSVWCPSIDTLLFARGLKKMYVDRRVYRKSGELGCGSGFISKYHLANADTMSMFVNDINPDAIDCARTNIQDARAVFNIGDGLRAIDGKVFNFLACNPPYVPRTQSIDDNPYEGIGLLKHLVHEGQKYLKDDGVIVTNVSSLCWDEVFSIKPDMQMRVLDEMTVPLKVNNIMNTPDLLNYLVNEGGLKKEYHDGYEYWQTLRIIELRKTQVERSEGGKE